MRACRLPSVEQPNPTLQVPHRRVALSGSNSHIRCWQNAVPSTVFAWPVVPEVPIDHTSHCVKTLATAPTDTLAKFVFCGHGLRTTPHCWQDGRMVVTPSWTTRRIDLP